MIVEQRYISISTPLRPTRPTANSLIIARIFVKTRRARMDGQDHSPRLDIRIERRLLVIVQYYPQHRPSPSLFMVGHKTHSDPN